NDQTKVFWHAQAGENFAGDLFANEKGVVTLGWQVGNGTITQTYNILDDRGTVNFFLSRSNNGLNVDGPPVNVSKWFDPAQPKTIHFRYNSIIQDSQDAEIITAGDIRNFVAEKVGT